MKGVLGVRLMSAVALSALVGACADQTMPVAPLASAGPVSFDVGTAAEGDLVICKAGNEPGSFTFDVSYTPKNVAGVPSAPRANDQVVVAVGACVTVQPKITVGRYVATVTEQAPPADWTLTGINVVSNQPPFAGGPVVIDVAGRTVSNIGVSNDNGATITFTNTYNPPPPPPPGGCTYTLGYWKTHSSYGPAPFDATWNKLPLGADTEFFLSGQTWLQVFNTAPAGNAYYQLAPQFMASVLNLLSGASAPANVTAALTSGVALFNSYTPAQVAALAKNSPVRAQFISLAGTLDQYNNGIIGPGHCGS